VIASCSHRTLKNACAIQVRTPMQTRPAEIDTTADSADPRSPK
jgi:hypothetical protein